MFETLVQWENEHIGEARKENSRGINNNVPKLVWMSYIASFKV